MSNEERLREEQWLQSLKVGDEVALWYWRGVRGRYEFTTITSETPTRWRINGRDFNKSDGMERGQLACCRFVEPTEGLRTTLLEDAEKSRLVDKLNRQTHWGSLPLGALKAVDALVTDAERNDRHDQPNS